MKEAEAADAPAGRAEHEPEVLERLEELHARSREAAQLLGLLSFFAARPVPLEVFSGAAELLPAPLAGASAAGASALGEVAGRLTELGLAERDGRGLRLAGEVARGVRARMSAVERSRFGGTAVRLLHRTFPGRVGRPEQRGLCDALAPHVHEVAAHPRAGGRPAAEAVHLLARLGAHESAVGRPEAARRAFRRALELAAAESPPVGEGVRAVLHDELASVAVALGREREAREHAAAGEAAARSAFPEDSPRRPVLLRNLASTYRELGDLGSAADCLERAMRGLDRTASPAAGPLRVELALALADVRMAGERFEAASERAGEALREAERLGPEARPLVARAAWMLGDVRRALGDPEGATPLFRRALDAEASVRGASHPAVGQKALALGLHLEERGRRREARRRYRQAVEVFERSLGEDSEALRAARARLASLERDGGD